MAHFFYRFTVPAPAAAVRAFHHDPGVLPRLSPPPIFVRLHRFEPLAEGSIADLTMWFGPIPVGWRAVHSDVGPNGFTDEQVSGPLRLWRHSHRFLPAGARRTRVEEEISYEHRPGWRGWLTRLAFNRATLTLLFTYRRAVTRRALQPPEEYSRLRFVLAGLVLVALWLRRRQQAR
jgi:ligand-binding SRPBCC domain-containing protein